VCFGVIAEMWVKTPEIMAQSGNGALIEVEQSSGNELALERRGEMSQGARLIWRTSVRLWAARVTATLVSNASRVGLEVRVVGALQRRRPISSAKGRQSSLASNVMVALRTLETGQFFSASLAKRENAAWSRFGTCARSVKAERLIRKP
jgi:hypothetical protein